MIVKSLIHEYPTTILRIINLSTLSVLCLDDGINRSIELRGSFEEKEFDDADVFKSFSALFLNQLACCFSRAALKRRSDKFVVEEGKRRVYQSQ